MYLPELGQMVLCESMRVSSLECLEVPLEVVCFETLEDVCFELGWCLEKEECVLREDVLTFPKPGMYLVSVEVVLEWVCVGKREVLLVVAGNDRFFLRRSKRARHRASSKRARMMANTIKSANAQTGRFAILRTLSSTTALGTGTGES